MAIVRWEPARELASMEVDRLNRMFSEFYDQTFSRGWVPPVDIYETDAHEVVLKAELPDMTREDIDITVDKGTLTLKGEKKLSNEVKEDDYHRIGRHYGTFSRSFSLPPTVDSSKVSADYKNGVLTARLPVREEAKPRQVKVEVAGA